jgi:hypothetical protein
MYVSSKATLQTRIALLDEGHKLFSPLCNCLHYEHFISEITRIFVLYQRQKRHEMLL